MAGKATLVRSLRQIRQSFLAFVELGVGSALLAALGFLVVNVLIGNVIKPGFMGRGLGLSTLVVFLSLVFWGWVLGQWACCYRCP